MARTDWQGVWTALVTTFQESGALDEAAFVRLVDRQISAGVTGLVPCGTTGETPALDGAEWERVVTLTIERAAGRVKVVPGTGSNNTPLTIARTRRARELGADAAMVVKPYYNKPNPAGLLAHYRAVASEGGLPVLVYNVPSRTGLNLTPEVLAPIAELDGVVALKEASGSMS
ncbi:MAG: dihydrodipicolinate synthase family protein, partial [Acidobacteriota bacterium]